MIEKQRYIVLTDIHKRRIWPWDEVDDTESLVRLLLYANEIDIRGIIPCTSCFVRKGARLCDLDVVYEVIDAYGQVHENLCQHADGYPSAKALRDVACLGIPEFGEGPGNGFGHERYSGNPGVNRIIDEADNADDRPLWIGLWGGANTLAQAVWQVWVSRPAGEFDSFISKLRVYAISDQDNSGAWLRKMFGDKLFYIVSPSHGTAKGARSYFKATWPGIAADTSRHGSEDGTAPGGFSGARADMVSREWIRANITQKGVLGACYPLPVFIPEGDTPSFLGLIPNGLNVPERPDFGGWGGRYQHYKPAKEQFEVEEIHPIWTNASDTVPGVDGNCHTSPQATIWRWREAFQNDFAARMDWTMVSRFCQANHPPVVKLAHEKELHAVEGERVLLDASPSADPDGDVLSFHWFVYKEAGCLQFNIEIINCGAAVAKFVAPQLPAGVSTATCHIIVAVQDNGTPPLTRYSRVIVNITKEN